MIRWFKQFLERLYFGTDESGRTIFYYGAKTIHPIQTAFGNAYEVHGFILADEEQKHHLLHACAIRQSAQWVVALSAFLLIGMSPKDFISGFLTAWVIDIFVEGVWKSWCTRRLAGCESYVGVRTTLQVLDDSNPRRMSFEEYWPCLLLGGSLLIGSVAWQLEHQGALGFAVSAPVGSCGVALVMTWPTQTFLAARYRRPVTWAAILLFVLCLSVWILS